VTNVSAKISPGGSSSLSVRAIRDRSPHCGTGVPARAWTGVLARPFGVAGLKFLEVCDRARPKQRPFAVAVAGDPRERFLFG
jgi:hypothetical protein